MSFTTESAEPTPDGSIQRQFWLDETVPGTIWEPAGGGGSLVLLAHGGGQNRAAPAILGRARLCVAAGFRAAALDAPGHGSRPRSALPVLESRPNGTGDEFLRWVAQVNADVAALAVPEWQAVTDALAPDGPVGFWGVSMGTAIGLPLVAAEKRIAAAVLGLAGMRDDLAEVAARVTAPIEFALQWNDELVPREEGLALFDALGSTTKTLHANMGRHHELPRFEADNAIRFLERHLGTGTA